MKKNLPAGARDRGSIPRVAKQLGLRAAATDLCAWSPCLQQEEPRTAAGSLCARPRAALSRRSERKPVRGKGDPVHPKMLKKKKRKKEISSFQKLNKSPRSADRNAELGDPGGPAPSTPSSSSEPEGGGRPSTAGWTLSGEQGLAEGPCVASVPFRRRVLCHRPSHSVQSLSPDHQQSSLCALKASFYLRMMRLWTKGKEPKD